MPSMNLPIASDTMIVREDPTGNFSTIADFYVGEYTPAGNVLERAFVKPDFSDIAGKEIISATLKMTPIYRNSDNTRTMYAHRVLRDVNYSQVTWNEYSTGNNWGTSGCSNSTTDYDGSVVIGSATVPYNITLNSALSFQMVLDADEIQKFNDGTYPNYGLFLFVNGENDDFVGYAAKENTTASYRPLITVDYIDRTKRFYSFLQNRRNRRSLVYG